MYSDPIFWSWKQVLEEFPDAPKSRAGRRLWVRRLKFPRPVYLTANAPRWHPDEVRSWFASRPRRYADAIAEVRNAT